MSWTERLNDALPRMRFGGAVVDVYEWAHWAEPVENPPHRHTYFEVCRVEGGDGRFVVEERSYPIGPGDLLFARPGVRHQILGPDGIHLSWVAFDVTADPRAAADDISVLLQGFLRADTAVVKDDGQVGAVWEVLKLAARGARVAGHQALLAALGQALLLGLARAGGGQDLAAMPQPATERNSRAVHMAVRYIHDNLDRPLRVEELARHVHVSPRQLTRLFASGLNTSPASYVERVRLERAAALLVRTETPIRQIAADLGYPDVPTFTRAFARQHGTPPGRFRRAADLSRVLTAPPPEV